MRIEQRTQGAVTVVKAEGPLTGDDVDQFRAAVRSASLDSLGRVVVDLSGVSHADSAGLEALVDLGELLASAGRVLKVCGLNETLLEVFELTGVEAWVEAHEDAADAARSFL